MNLNRRALLLGALASPFAPTPNRILNADMTIWRRETKAMKTSSEYKADRWLFAKRARAAPTITFLNPAAARA